MSQNRKMPSKPPICREWENEPEMIQKKKQELLELENLIN